jgi:hypothetical protein
MKYANNGASQNNSKAHLLAHSRQMRDLKRQAQLLRMQAYSDAYEWLGNQFRKLRHQTSKSQSIKNA